MINPNEQFDLMTVIKREDGTEIWHKVGVLFIDGRIGNGGKVGVVSLLSLPIGATAPVRMQVYPAKKGT